MSAYRITRKGSLCFGAMTTRTPLKHNDPMRLKIAASVIVCVTILVVAEFSNAATGLDIHKKLLALGSVVFAAMNIGSIITWLKGARDASRVLFYSVMPLMLITVAVNEGHAIVLTMLLGIFTTTLFIPEFLNPGWIAPRRWFAILLSALVTGLFIRLGWRGLDFVSSPRDLAPVLLAPALSLVFLWLLVRAIFVRLQETTDRLAEKNASLLESQRELERASAAKSQFLANMSHELRTPLNAIIGYSEMIQEELELESQQDSPWYEDIVKVQNAGQHLLALISDVLDLSKIEAGRMKLVRETVDLTDLCREIAQTCSPLIKAKENALTLKLDEQIEQLVTDRTKVRQILFNLVSNAAKFTTGGEITIETRLEAANMVSITVSDTGIGISDEERARLFTPFEQADGSTTREYGGTGLGLALVKQLAELLGGEVWLESEPGVGSHFEVTLPTSVAEPHAGEEAQPRSSHVTSVGDSASRPILVIDDDPSIRHVLTRTLTRAGWQVEARADAASGLEAARALDPSLIILDLLLPDINGWQVLRELRLDSNSSTVPVVISSILEERTRGIEMGAAGFLSKPINRTELFQMIELVVGHDELDVLVVDDIADNRELLARMLSNHTKTFREAENGAIAIELLSERVPDLILLDLMMPDVDGFEVLAQIGREPAWQGVPVVIVTAKTLTEEELSVLERGTKHIIAKADLNKAALVNAVTSAMVDR